MKKVGIVKKALAHHADPSKLTTSTILARYGGAEIAALVGSILQASELNLPVIVDGFIVTVAALVAALLSPNAIRVMFFATQSTEKGHRVAFEKIMEVAKQNNIPVPASPVLAMELRMGEATGALLAVPLIRSATGVLGDMSTLVQILASTQ
jgi:nicotinate-nucleotide--dimethylbenzimidazole phosphoribosyltransferase